jgi:hypothetical protein
MDWPILLIMTYEEMSNMIQGHPKYLIVETDTRATIFCASSVHLLKYLARAAEFPTLVLI